MWMGEKIGIIITEYIFLNKIIYRQEKCMRVQILIIIILKPKLRRLDRISSSERATSKPCIVLSPEMKHVEEKQIIRTNKSVHIFKICLDCRI